MNGFEIRKLSEDTLNDFLDFFDDRAFCDNPDWAGCYCCFFYVPDDEILESKSGGENRKLAGELVRSGKMHGYIAYSDGKPVGWCNADDIKYYPRILNDEAIEQPLTEKAAAVVCFVTDPDYRKRGIAAQLLSEICLDFTSRGYDYIEAYPRRTAEGDAINYHGPLGMYESAGFGIYLETDDFYILRKYL